MEEAKQETQVQESKAQSETTQEAKDKEIRADAQETKKLPETKVLTLNLRRYILNASRFKGAKKAIKSLKQLVLRHSKAKEVKISARLNQYIWARGIKKPPAKVTVKIIKKEDTAYVDLAS